MISKPESQPSLGQAIKEARNAKALSLRGLEDLTGIPNAHLSQIENGKIEQPSMARLFVIARALDLEYSSLLKLAGHAGAKTSGAKGVPGISFRGSEDLTPEEADEVQQFITLIKGRQQ